MYMFDAIKFFTHDKYGSFRVAVMDGEFWISTHGLINYFERPESELARIFKGEEDCYAYYNDEDLDDDDYTFYNERAFWDIYYTLTAADPKFALEKDYTGFEDWICSCFDDLANNENFYNVMESYYVMCKNYYDLEDKYDSLMNKFRDIRAICDI